MIAVAVVFMIICWMAGLIFTVNFGLTQPQYGTKKDDIKFNIFFYTGMALLFILAPALGFYFAL
jgi:hypothetical protein